MTTRSPETAPRRAIIEATPEPAVPQPLGDGADWLRALDWRAFEQLVADAYRRQGFSVLPTAFGADGGIDLILNRGAERVFVQCKHWRSYQVGVGVVRELFGLVAAYRATGGIVVSSGRFTPEAVEFARVSGVILLDGPAVVMMTAAGPPATSRPVFASPPTSPSPGQSALGAATGVPPWPAPVPSQRVAPAFGVAPRPAPVASLRPYRVSSGGRVPPTATPRCPICTAPMVQRRARRGPAAGSRFWGCSRYPGCKGVRELDAVPTHVPDGTNARPQRTLKRVVNRLTYRVAQVLTILLGAGMTAVVVYGVLTAMLHR